MNRLLLVLLVALICHQAMGNPKLPKDFGLKGGDKEDEKKVDEGNKVNENTYETKSHNENKNYMSNEHSVQKDTGHKSGGKKQDMDAQGPSRDCGDGGKGGNKKSYGRQKY